MRLPPRPDPATGEPRPPQAPVYREPHNGGVSTQGSAPKSPPGYGPALEYYSDSNRDAVKSGIFAFVLFVVFATVYNAIRVGFTSTAFGWMSTWWLWLICAAAALLIWRANHGSFWAAGADWLRTKTAWVRTYELVTVKGMVVGSAARLELTDAVGNSMSVIASDLQRHRRLWDLVYNGILYSIARGATTNRLAHGLLQLDKAELGELEQLAPEDEEGTPAEAFVVRRRRSSLRRWLGVALLVLGCVFAAVAVISGFSNEFTGPDRVNTVVTTGVLALMLLAGGAWLRRRRARGAAPR
jgi:hypothetical protein